MLRKLLLLLALLVPFAVFADDPSAEPPWIQLNARLNARWLNGDSLDQVSLYPAWLDSAGLRVDLSYTTNERFLWIGTNFPSGTGWYDAWETAGNDTSLGFKVFVWDGTLHDNAIASAAAFQSGVVDAAALASGAAAENLFGGSNRLDVTGTTLGSDSTNVLGDTLSANVGNFAGALYVQAGEITSAPNPAIAFLYVDEANFRLRTLLAEFLGDSVYVAGVMRADSLMGYVIFPDSVQVVDYLQVDGPAWLRSDVDLGTGLSNTVGINGSAVIENDIDVQDDAIFRDDLTLGDHETQSVITITANTAVNGNVAIADSAQVATTFGAADSARVAFRLANGWLEVPSVMSHTFTLANGDGDEYFDWDGLRANDWCGCNPLATSTATGPSLSGWTLTKYTGKLRVQRASTTGTVVLDCLAMKR